MGADPSYYDLSLVPFWSVFFHRLNHLSDSRRHEPLPDKMGDKSPRQQPKRLNNIDLLGLGGGDEVIVSHH
jgi:hypothetical protein